MEKLTSYLRAKRLKQKDFAALIGVSPGAISQWLTAARIPLERVARVHEVTGIPIHDLAPELFSFAQKSGGKVVRSRSQSRPRRLREPANA